MSSGMLSHQESNKHRNTIIIHSIHSRLKQNAYALVWFLENEIIHLHIRATLKLLTCPCSVLRKKKSSDHSIMGVYRPPTNVGWRSGWVTYSSRNRYFSFFFTFLLGQQNYYYFLGHRKLIWKHFVNSRASYIIAFILLTHFNHDLTKIFGKDQLKIKT